MPRIRICKEPNCNNAGVVKGYCRLHYLKNWKKLKSEGRKRATESLNRYVEGICKKHPDRYVEVIRKNIKDSRFGLLDDPFETDDLDQVSGELGCDDEDLDQLISKIKIDEGF